MNATDFSAANYYDRSRARTYASCFSLENSDYIWEHYANGRSRGKVAIVVEFGKVGQRLRQSFENGEVVLEVDGRRVKQILSLSIGLVEYVDWSRERANLEHLANPIPPASCAIVAKKILMALRVKACIISQGKFAAAAAVRIEELIAAVAARSC